ncbi:MAG: 3-deoxy-7-phosphoheptulonate synthase [Candidatus Theseobacter exili]|nr:3-deoxy-7-phosphoheptulonate synthase [Candidatus Theseobacter exili]
MSFEYIRVTPSPEEILATIPMSKKLKAIKKKRDKELIAVLEKRSDKFIIIIGPCSAHNEDAVCEYVSRLAQLQEKVKDKLILVPRIYTNKPRTTGAGYKGMVHQPNPQEKPDFVGGLKALRKMHIRALAESHLPAADEMLYPGNYPYIEDILCYVTVGARSVENQQHRLTISGLDILSGMKNPTSGDFQVMLNSVQAAQMPHVFTYNGWEVSTSGNPYAHSILRGSVNHFGQNIPNYHYEDLVKLSEIYFKRPLANPTIIVDTNHSNSNKDFREQPRIALEVMRSRQSSDLLNNIVRGLMIESYLEEGSQEVSGKVFGQSITDSCLGWNDSANLILNLADSV